MKIKGFQILNYRSIIDSGWVDIDDLTVLVGKNESGKTSLLRALHKFSPFKADPYLIDREWPRGQRHKRNPDTIVCRVRFELGDDELAQLYPALDDPATQSGPFVIGRTYAGRYHLELPDALFPAQPPKSSISGFITELDNLRPPSNTSISSDVLQQSISRIKQWAYGGNVDQIDSIGSISELLLLNIDNPAPEDANFCGALDACVRNISNGMRSSPTIRMLVEKFILERIPVFIYMDDYRAFRGSALLDMVKERKDRNELTDEDKTLITILELSGLDLDSEFTKGGSNDQNVKEQRQYDLNDAGNSLTTQIAQRWNQRKYEVEFRADRHSFFTMVRDETGPYLIPLEERSKGFQWFFSFDLMFMYESRGSFKGCVLLLDEPGLHLHASAQMDLLARLEAYAKNNSLIYTTHLPFMIDLKQPSRIKTISEGASGTVVDKTLNLSQPDAKLTLQSALGMSASTSYLVAQRNLVVEGVDDYIILNELSNLFIRSGRLRILRTFM